VFGREKRSLAVRLFEAQVDGPIVTYPFKPGALGDNPRGSNPVELGRGSWLSSVPRANSKRLRAIIIITTNIPHTCVPFHALSYPKGPRSHVSCGETMY
jgi:hypothetical protein